MSKVSAIIPARNERWAVKTVNDLLEKSTGDIEVVLVLDGYWPEEPIPEDNRLHVFHSSQPMGMRTAINIGAQLATGDFIMKVDAHCMFGQGFDQILADNCDGDWLVIPRRVSLDVENWTVLNTGKSPVDYEYLSCPDPIEKGMHGSVWNQRARERKDNPEYDIDENMSFQGSCWFMSRSYFWNHVGGLSTEGYGHFIQEPQELGLKVWLGGGKTMVNKLTWYAHLHKGKKYGRGWFLNKREAMAGNAYSTKFWMNNEWPGRIHDLKWLIKRFEPVPTWPEDWETRWQGTTWTH